MTRSEVQDTRSMSSDSGVGFLLGPVAQAHLPGAPELHSFSESREDTDDDECGPGGTGSNCTPPSTKSF